MVDLVNNIKNKPLRFPKEVNKISEVTEDVIRKNVDCGPEEAHSWGVIQASNKHISGAEDKSRYGGNYEVVRRYITKHVEILSEE